MPNFVRKLEPVMCERELQFYPWIRKLSERLHLLNYNVRAGVDISDQDVELLKKLFPLWSRGEIIYMETVMEGDCESVSQSSLFSANNADKK